VKAQRLRAQQASFGEDRDQILLVSHHEGRDAGASRAFHHGAEQAVRFARVGAGRQEVAALKVKRIDTVAIDEAPQIDLAAFLGRQRLELLVGHQDDLAVVELVAARDLVRVDGLFMRRAMIPPRERCAVRVDHAQR
jgi:hypothetical protein